MVVRACLGAGGLSMFGGGCLRLKYSPLIKRLWGSSTFHLCFKMSALQCVGCQTWNRNCKRGYMHVFSVPGRFLLNWQRSAPLWSAGLTVHILYTQQTGGSLCTCQRGGSVWRHGPSLSKVCHPFFLPCHQSYLIPPCFWQEAFLPHS